jgi:hypothetical protein
VGRFEELAMHASQYVANPFGMLTDPQSILRALEGSQRLEGLNRSFDHSIDDSAVEDEAE